eukprot:5666402-Pyramimonas_sp.AAC.1
MAGELLARMDHGQGGAARPPGPQPEAARDAGRAWSAEVAAQAAGGAADHVPAARGVGLPARAGGQGAGVAGGVPGQRWPRLPEQLVRGAGGHFGRLPVVRERHGHAPPQA